MDRTRRPPACVAGSRIGPSAAAAVAAVTMGIAAPLRARAGPAATVHGPPVPTVERSDRGASAPASEGCAAPSAGSAASDARPPAGHVLPPTARGTGLLVTAGLAGGAALALHAVALGAFRRTCGLAEDGIDQFQNPDGSDPQQQTEAVFEIAAFGILCGVSIGPSLTLRMTTPVLLGGAMAVAAGGAHLRGEYLAYRDVFVRPRTRKISVGLGVGGALTALGGTLWIVSRLFLLRNRVGCDSLSCLAGYDFATLHASAMFSIAGTGVLAQTLAYRTRHAHYSRLRDLRVVPVAFGRGGGLAASASF